MENTDSTRPPPDGSPDPTVSSGAALPLYLRLLLDKNQGVVLEVLDAVGTYQQTVILDGTTLTLNVRGPAGQSTIVQTPERIAMNTKHFSIDAETVRITTRQSTELLSLGDTTVTGLSDITLQTPGTVKSYCGDKFEVNSMHISLDAISKVSAQCVGKIEMMAVAGIEMFASNVNIAAIETAVIGSVLSLLGLEILLGVPVKPSSGVGQAAKAAGGLKDKLSKVGDVLKKVGKVAKVVGTVAAGISMMTSIASALVTRIPGSSGDGDSSSGDTGGNTGGDTGGNPGGNPGGDTGGDLDVGEDPNSGDADSVDFGGDFEL